MPGGNGTGPMGQGPMTGRGAGYCPGSGMQAGFAAGRGFSGGMGRRNRFFAGGQNGRRNLWMMGTGASCPYGNYDPELEKQVLEKQADNLQTKLEIIKKRLSEIE